ncbi:MAG: ammonia-forming cytochrome c nitrite reductase subunit c552 [Candidatus Hodarchaeales archaeon]|jgi:predicted CXXCH cytochrome family protein
MKGQQVKLIRQSKTNGKRVVLLYWFSIVFLGTAAAAALGTGVLNPSFSIESTEAHPTIAEPWQPEDCKICHSVTYNAWNATSHSDSTYRINATHIWRMNKSVAEDYFNTRDCINCHATGYENTTATTGNNAVEDIWSFGITCAACHETPGVIDYTAENCGKCHSAKESSISPGHHLGSQYEDYNKSGHSESIPDLMATGYAEDSCLHCMSGQGTYAGDGTDGIQKDELLLSNSVITSINCATCHDPHDATNEGQLREATVQEVCGECHSGDPERYSTLEMLTDAGTTSSHGTIDCTDCHGYQLVNDQGIISNRMNHTWGIDFGSCAQACHGDTAATRKSSVESVQASTTTLLNEFDKQITNVTAIADEANSTFGVDRAKIDDAFALINEAKLLVAFVTGDSSTGFHNPDLAAEKITQALMKLNEAYNKVILIDFTFTTSPTTSLSTSPTTSLSTSPATSLSTSPTKTSNPSPNITSAINILAMISILSIIVLFRRKRY